MVVGQLARDVVVQVGALPEPGTSADVTGRRETLGGKGANQAVAVAQLGQPVSLVAVAGDDVIGDHLLAQAVVDGIDVRTVVRRAGALSGLIVEVLESGGRWRYLQHLPEPVLLTRADVAAAGAVLKGAAAVLVQLQQPAEAAREAARRGREADALVVLDGVADAELAAMADVVRADEHEARLLPDDLLTLGPRLVALGVDGGNRFFWPGGEVFLPHPAGSAVDTTGAGDAFTAALAVALVRGEPPESAARRAVDATAQTVGRPGGRPALRPW
ncbi:ribokinase [Actinoplanes ianthinogenes]|uniref:Ribokinase n=1 Tax=Actinoplanes ianthinogenes TaxID=122358 RepID=A0ABM7M5V5_9ACTN|nr:ribokinase [Actinoplanes ianthinogenes]GGR13775.1 ribokinase [Actinoplanes ianthinogenes]